ncbi:MAG: ABC transporter permease subunit [Ilumatobacter sp.]|uniref:ABC transporter permease subunit n=1 Tax=Ilumatobacter sp. TaxID=1967498 RepID=UPI00391BE70B
MDTLTSKEIAGDHPDKEGAEVVQRLTRPRAPGEIVKLALGVVAFIGLIYWAVVEEKIRSTLITVVIAVAASAGLWIGANLLFNNVRDKWERFSAIAFGAIGAVFGIVLHGNLVTLGSGEGFFTWVLGPLVGAAAFGAIGIGLALSDDPNRRLAIAVGGSAVIGVAIGVLIREEFQPGLDPVAIAVYTAIGVAIGGGLGALRKRNPLHGALIVGALGWIFGAWGGADFGDGSLATSIIAALVPALALGYRLGLTANPGYRERVQIDTRSRATIFVGPALLFIFIMLVVPTIRTAYLSLLDRDSEAFVELENYGAVFTDKNSLDISNWTNMFTSVPFVIGAVLLLIAVGVGYVMRQRTGRAVELGNATSGPLVVGALLVSFGIFTALRGTLINNLWWVVVVTFTSTAMGLAIAVLADNRGGERIAKSIIFMPMAISLVGASIIWRFVYTARDVSTEQTGVLNALWVGLGRLSTGSGLPTLISTIVLGLAVLGLIVWLARALVARAYARAVVPAVLTLLVGWFFIRFAGIIGGGVGGFRINDDGSISAQTVFFVQETPYNNFWLMIIFIWIQTGFSMVILSAAIKAVPTELIEAAKIDGATDSQVFWRVTLPQIATTIGVVVTTLIVGVMKVFDIVKVTTNGQFGTQVLANQMFQEAFSFGDTGKGAALAMLIFLAVLPVMIYNIRNMQKEEG